MKKSKKFLIVFSIAFLFGLIIKINPVNATEDLFWPVPGHTNINRGPDGYYDANGLHVGNAIDITDSTINGSSVYAAKGGVVTNIFLCGVQHYGSEGDCCGFGTGLVILGDDGRYYQYAHMQYGSIPSNVYYGARVERGQFIGKVGTTGNSSGPHLHYGISLGAYYNQSGINPIFESYVVYLPGGTIQNLGESFIAQIVPKNSQNYAVTVDGTANGSNVYLYQSNPSSKTQQWKFTRLSNGSYKIESLLAPGYVLDVAGSGDDDRDNIRLWQDANGIKQSWYIYDYNGAYRLVAASGIDNKRGLACYDGFINNSNIELHQPYFGTNTFQTFAFRKYVNSISLDTESICLDEGESKLVKATINPSDATEKKVEWLSSNPQVATVDQEGNITAISSGNAIITVKTTDGSAISKSIDVVVKTTKISLENAEVRYTVTTSGMLIYNGKPRTLAVEVKLDDKVLVKDKDYKVEYLNNTEVGIGTTKITGIGDYIGVVTKTFEIIPTKQSIENATVRYTITTSGVLIYNGKSRTLAVEVKLDDKVLVKDKDYKVEYLNNKEVGTGTTKITGIGIYSGIVTKTFEIKPATQSIKNATVRYTVTPSGLLIYNGNSRTLAVEVKLDNKVLVRDKDYKVEYINNKNVGIGTTKITGIGNYSGVVEKSFYIKSVCLEQASITYKYTPSGVLVYNGNARYPAIDVKVNGELLVKDRDYKVEYINNKNVGTAMVIVSGIGNYSGTITKTFEIVEK